MSVVFHLRTDSREPAPASGVLLDWFGRGGPSTISGSPPRELVNGMNPPDDLALDFLRIAVAVYGADRVVSREAQSDGWTRQLSLHVPVSDVERWRTAAPTLQTALAFLTNDGWDLRFRVIAPAGRNQPGHSASPGIVALFSGGLDSLAGAINLLEQGQNVMLVGHHDSNLLLPRQQTLVAALRREYGNRVNFRPFYLRPAGKKPSQARPLPSGRESTTRSRSLLFLAAAGVIASAAGLRTVHMPENGYVGLNIPLEASRVGACSTRTTHPHFIALLSKALGLAGLELAIENPLRLLTKGEVLSSSLNSRLVLRLSDDTVSCAHPEVGRWQREGYANCGYCYPCILRRASLHAVRHDHGSRYRVDVGQNGFLRAGGEITDHLRAICAAITAPDDRLAALRAGPLPRGEVASFVAVHQRGREELRAWIMATLRGNPGFHS